MSRNPDGSGRSVPEDGRLWRGGPLKVRNFRLLSLGQLTSTVGDYCYAVALPWLVLSSHGGTVLLGIVLACYGLPRAVLIPVGGVLADRLSPRAVMLAADTARCLLVTALAVLAVRRTGSLVFLGPIVGLVGAGEGLFLPASAAIMPRLLPTEMLQAGNGLSAAMVQAGSFAGPVLGGVLITVAGAAAGPAIAFAADGASFAVSAAALVMMRGAGAAAAGPADQPAPAPGLPAGPGLDADVAAARSGSGEPAGPGSDPGTTTGPDAAEPDEPGALRLLLRAREFQAIVMISVLANFVVAAAFEVALPALAHARFGADGYGALVACFGAGAIAGTLAAARMTDPARPAVTVSASFLVAALAAAALPFAGGLPGAAAADLLFGATAGLGNVVAVTLLQHWAPARLLGRVMSIVMLASVGTFPVSVALAGLIIHQTGPSPFFPVAGAVLAATVVLALAQPRFRAFGARPGSPPGQAAVEAR